MGPCEIRLTGESVDLGKPLDLLNVGERPFVRIQRS